MRQELHRLINRAAVAWAHDPAEGARFLKEEFVPYLTELHSDMTAALGACQLMLDMAMVHEQLTQPDDRPPAGAGARTKVDEMGAAFQRTSARNGALLVLLDEDGLTVAQIRERMLERGHRSVGNISSALSKAANTDSPLVNHIHGRYYLTERGREVAEGL